MELIGIPSGTRYINYELKRKWAYYKSDPIYESTNRHKINKIAFLEILNNIALEKIII